VVSDRSRRDFLAAATTAAVLPAIAPACRSRSAAPAADEAPPLDLDWGFPPGAVRVGLNESPLGPSPVAAQAMARAIGECHRYVRSTALEQKLAERHRLSIEWVALGCGSTELLRDLPHTLDRSAHVIATRESYRDLIDEARRRGLATTLLSVDGQHGHDLPAMRAAITDATRMVCLTNPNNPTGTTLPRAAVEGFAASLPPAVTLVVDQAYIGFAPHDDVSDLVSRFGNLIVIHTFSKLWGLAGVRVGYALGHPRLLAPLRQLALRNHIGAISYAGAVAALDDLDYPARYRALAADGRAYFSRELAARGLGFALGDAPFVLIDARPLGGVVERLAEQRVFVRPGRDWDLPGWIRVSFGTMDENRAVLAAFDRVRSG
jgi:histidinol-phosphate aminotransferase